MDPEPTKYKVTVFYKDKHGMSSIKTFDDIEADSLVSAKSNAVSQMSGVEIISVMVEKQ